MKWLSIMPAGDSGSAFEPCAGVVICGTTNAFIGFTVSCVLIKNDVQRNGYPNGCVNRFWFLSIRIRSGQPIS